VRRADTLRLFVYRISIMRKPPRRRRPKARSRSLSIQNLIVLLLVVLIILTGANLYFNHLSGSNEATAPKTGATLKEKLTTAPRKTAADSAGSAAALPAPLSKPSLVPALTNDMPEPGKIHIQLLNGCGAKGLATKARLSLRQRGFDILTFGNAQAQDYKQTLIIARSPLPAGELAARRVANALGVTVDQIKIEQDPNLVDTDVTLILGYDYTKLNLITE
jgi:hypothetical protein